MKIPAITGLILASLLTVSLSQAQSLRGSPASIDKQYRTALSYGYTFVNNARSVKDYVNPQQLVRVNPDRHLELHDVSFPYAVPATRQFLLQLSQQYHNSCGEKLTVTSLLRPRDRQPRNSVERSVHPAGMAVDLRVPSSRKCRLWLENTLLAMEKQHVLDVTRERRPPHYHVAVFARDSGSGGALGSGVYIVSRGDTLSRIASRTGVPIAQLRAANGLRGDLIKVGQKLRVPTTLTVASAAKGQASTGQEITYLVTRGDTLWQIANRYGTSVEKLRQSNRNAGDSLQVGQVLRISKG
jgi:LysM repeat protein